VQKQKGKFPYTIRDKKFFLMIIHRQEHVLFKKEWTKKMMKFVIENSDDNLVCVLLNHPLTVEIINQLDLKKKKVQIIDQLPYIDFLKLFQRCEFIATDSATNQQEAFYLGKPYLGLADFSVQTEGLGKNALLAKSDFKLMQKFLINYKNFHGIEETDRFTPIFFIITIYFDSNWIRIF
jgi:UDP-N-acetylglucosamine 2-epimerase (non-hydrolysing)